MLALRHAPGAPRKRQNIFFMKTCVEVLQPALPTSSFPLMPPHRPVGTSFSPALAQRRFRSTWYVLPCPPPFHAGPRSI